MTNSVNKLLFSDNGVNQLRKARSNDNENRSDKAGFVILTATLTQVCIFGGGKPDGVGRTEPTGERRPGDQTAPRTVSPYAERSLWKPVRSS